MRELGKKQINKRGDSKVESNDIPDILDRGGEGGGTSDIPGVPMGKKKKTGKTKTK